MTRLMDDVSSAIQDPDGSSVGTVEPGATATLSSAVFTDIPLGTARPKPEVAPKPVIT